MSGFYVPGFTPSGEGFICYIYPDGTVIKPKSDGIKGKDKGMFDVYKGIPVPEHGRVIDSAALWGEISKICDRRDAGIITDLTCLQQLLSAVRQVPTIIPADPDKEGEG